MDKIAISKIPKVRFPVEYVADVMVGNRFIAKYIFAFYPEEMPLMKVSDFEEGLRELFGERIKLLSLLPRDYNG